MIIANTHGSLWRSLSTEENVTTDSDDIINIHNDIHSEDKTDISSRGVKFNQGKLRLDLVPPEMEEALAEGLTAGIKKGYEENNWMKGLPFSWNVAASKRHLNLWRKGVDTDKETGVNHIKLAALNLLMIAYQIEHKREDLDDRVK